MNDHIFEILRVNLHELANDHIVDYQPVEQGSFPETPHLSELTDITNTLLDLDAKRGSIDLSLLALDNGVLTYNKIPLIQVTEDGGIERLRIEDFHNCPFGLDDDGYIIL